MPISLRDHAFTSFTPQPSHMNGNKAMFGGSSIYMLFEAAWHHDREMQTQGRVTCDKNDTPGFTIADFEFHRPGIIGEELNIECEIDGDGIKVAAYAADGEPVLSGTFHFKGNISKEHLHGIYEYISCVDILAGARMNWEPDKPEDVVFVTRSFSYLRMDNLEDLQPLLPPGLLLNNTQDRRHVVENIAQTLKPRAESEVCAVKAPLNTEFSKSFTSEVTLKGGNGNIVLWTDMMFTQTERRAERQPNDAWLSVDERQQFIDLIAA